MPSPSQMTELRTLSLGESLDTLRKKNHFGRLYLGSLSLERDKAKERERERHTHTHPPPQRPCISWFFSVIGNTHTHTH